MTLREWMHATRTTAPVLRDNLRQHFGLDYTEPAIYSWMAGRRQPNLRVALALHELTNGQVVPSTLIRGADATA